MFLFRKAILIIHGFSGGTWENEFLANTLELNPMFDVYSFTLPGHDRGTMSKVKHTDWTEACEKQVEKLMKNYNTIYIVGHSMGGVLATYLASKYRAVKRLVLIAPAFEYLNFSQNGREFKSIFKEDKVYGESFYHELLGKAFRVPAANIIEFMRLVKVHKECIKEVKCPVLLLHGTYDEIIPTTSTKYVFDNIKSKNKIRIDIEEARHRVFWGDKKEKICKIINVFLKGGTGTWKLKKISKI